MDERSEVLASSSGDPSCSQPTVDTCHESPSSSLLDKFPEDEDVCDSTTRESKTVDGKHISIKEGKAEILSNDNRDSVFYNPVQEFNRDISIAVLSVFSNDYKMRRGRKRTNRGNVKVTIDNGTEKTPEVQERLSILEGLAATGLRSIRYALEVVPQPREIIANDISSAAVASIQLNIKHNKVENIVSTSQNDASLAMHIYNSQGKKFDVVDVDPYGCPSKFLDGMVQVVEEGGLAMITCTDMAVLAGNTPETCYVKYGAVSLRSAACHEMALRIALQCVQSHANRYGRYIVPLLSISVDFYIRFFVRIFTSPSSCKDTTSNLSQIFQCVGCKSFSFQPLGIKTLRQGKPAHYSLPKFQPISKCSHCDHQFQMGGPIWTGPLYDKEFVGKIIEHIRCEQNIYKTSKRIEGMLTMVINELEDVPLYYVVDSICSVVHCEMIPLIHFRSALLNAGYLVSESHAATNSVKTNAPSEFIWDIIRAWEKDHPVSEKRVQSCQVTKHILRRNQECQDPNRNDEDIEKEESVNFTFHPHARPPTLGLLRYQTNPMKNWGPGLRSTNNTNYEQSQDAKRKQNQNKRKNQSNMDEQQSESSGV